MKKVAIVLLLFLSAIGGYSQSLYDINTVQEVRVYFSFTNWDYRMDTANAGSESYTIADSVVLNGVRFTQCGVRYKGNSSYSASRAKNPLHIKLDFTTSQDYQGYTDLKLANGYSDPSMIREVSSYEMLRKYMDAPLSNFIKVFVNGSSYGLMTNDESISEDFLLEHFYSSDGTFFKCNPLNVMTGSGPNLAYLGTDSSAYASYYELKSDIGWNNLVHLCDSLSNFSSQINTHLDIDRVLWMLAFNNVFVNLDSYSGSFKQNYYLYRNHQQQWIPIVWDVNMSFGSFTQTGSGGGSSLTALQNMSSLLHSTDSNWPLISKILSNPQYKRMYIAHMKTLNTENFLGAQYKTSINAMRAMIDTIVQNDAHFLYTYAQYTSNLNSTVTTGGPGGGFCGVYQLMDTRTTYLNGTTEFNYSAPAISNELVTPSVPAFGSSPYFTCTVSNSTAVYLGYRYKKSDRFIRVAMLDDGAHGDGAAGDLVFGISIPMNSLEVEYYVYAENANAGIFSPERAEHEFYTVHPSIAQATPGNLVINEYSSNNQDGLTNEAGKHKDWIEVKNKTSNPLGLSDVFLSDDLGTPLKWKFPDIAYIPASGYLLVWADDKDSTYLDYHTNFVLNSSGDSLYMNSGATVLYDSSSFSPTIVNRGFARCPDETGVFQLTDFLTPLAMNTCSLSYVAPALGPVSSTALYPNPALSRVYVTEGSMRISGLVSMMDVTGKLIREELNYSESGIDVSGLAPGLYFVSFVDSSNSRRVLKFIKE